MKFFETSAMNNINIEESFKQLSMEIIKIKEAKNAGNENSLNQPIKIQTLVKEETKKKKGCC
jgi:GTPase SAR1 family protein